jgi:hypothetical protein
LYAVDKDGSISSSIAQGLKEGVLPAIKTHNSVTAFRADFIGHGACALKTAKLLHYLTERKGQRLTCGGAPRTRRLLQRKSETSRCFNEQEWGDA